MGKIDSRQHYRRQYYWGIEAFAWLTFIMFFASVEKIGLWETGAAVFLPSYVLPWIDFLFIHSSLPSDERFFWFAGSATIPAFLFHIISRLSWSLSLWGAITQYVLIFVVAGGLMNLFIMVEVKETYIASTAWWHVPVFVLVTIWIMYSGFFFAIGLSLYMFLMFLIFFFFL